MKLLLTQKKADFFKERFNLKEYPEYWVIIPDAIPLTKVDVKEVEDRLNDRGHFKSRKKVASGFEIKKPSKN